MQFSKVVPILWSETWNSVQIICPLKYMMLMEFVQRVWSDSELGPMFEITEQTHEWVVTDIDIV